MDKKILFAGVNVIAILALYASYFGNSFLSNSTITLTTTNNGSITPNAALDELIAGNIRFVTGNLNKKDLSSIRRQELYNYGQKPFAIVVTCSDSRVSPELLFDVGLGDLFVVRTAGNVVDPISIGSVEYGAEHLGVPLIIVMGHDKCGAVKATIDDGEAEGSIDAIVNEIKPSVDKVKSLNVKNESFADMCENENIKNTVAELNKSTIIKKLIAEKKLKIVGAKYHLDTGNISIIEEIQ